jgi:hypothetical protein
MKYVELSSSRRGRVYLPSQILMISVDDDQVPRRVD